MSWLVRTSAPSPREVLLLARHHSWRLALSVAWRLRVITAAIAMWLVYVVMSTITAHLWETATALVGTFGALAGWRRYDQPGFTRRVVAPLRSRWRDLFIFGRNWQPAMVMSGLGHSWGGRQEIPARSRTVSTEDADTFYAAMLPGQVMSDWVKVADRLAQSFNMRTCRVSPGPTHQLVQLTFWRRDVLDQKIPVCDTGTTVRPDALPVARKESGGWYLMPLKRVHLLLAGASGAGKSAALWSIIRALAPGIGHGIELWVADPKGGLEMYRAGGMFHRFVYGGESAADMTVFAELLEDAVTEMRRRQRVIREAGSDHQATRECPWIVLLLDEIASLTSYNPDKKTRDRIEIALNLILSQGRACGITVIGALQDPRKETLKMRDLFTLRVGLRMTESDHVAMVLGDGARGRGAVCDAIPEALPGVGYVVADGTAGVERVRFSFLSEDERLAMIDSVTTRLAKPSHGDEVDAA